MTIDDLFKERCESLSDISPHLPYLRHLADQCDIVVEFGVRHGNSTVAFLASNCHRVYSYDISKPDAILPPKSAAKWGFIQADTSKLGDRDIPFCDMLFIDTLHTAEQVRHELRQAYCVHKYIAFHDTYTNGSRDEGTHPDEPVKNGIMEPILQFLANHPAWRVKSHTIDCNGLTVLERI